MQGSNIWNADNLWNKAISEFNSGQKSLARRTFKACLELARPGSLVFGYSLLYIGRCYENHKKVIYLKLAVELLHKLESDAASDLFAELSLAYLSIGRLSKAIKTSLRALHASKTDPQKLAKCKMLEAEILLFCGGAEDALNLLQSWDVVSNLNGLMIELRYANLFSRVLLLVDRIEEAVEYRELELKLCKRLGNSSIEYGFALKSASLFFKDCGLRNEALEAAKEAITILELYLGHNVPEIEAFSQEIEELVSVGDHEYDDVDAESASEERKEECLICMDSRISQFGILHDSSIHTGFCETCIEALQSQNINSCPLCNQRIERVIKIF